MGLECVDQAISIAPEEIWLYANRAHALMFLGRVEEAREVYLRYRGEKMRRMASPGDDRPWRFCRIAKVRAELSADGRDRAAACTENVTRCG